MAKVKQGNKPTKLVRKDSQKGGMPSGVGYRTFDKAGNSTNYAKASDAAGYNDTTQSRADMSKGNPLYRADSAGKVITSASIAPVTKVPLATPAPVDSLYGRTNAANAALATMAGGTYDSKTNQMTTAASTQPGDNSQAILSAFQTANASLEAPSAVNSFKEMDKMIRPKQRTVDSLSAQINSITQTRDAEMLGLEGQGRGVTESIIGGQQAQISREAAILAMPLQTQLAIAQDDLESARTYAGQYFQAKMQDDTNKYNLAKENNRLVFDFLNTSEQRRIAQNDKALDREYAEKQSVDKTAENITMQAIEYGQSSLAQRVMNLDRKSPTYAEDVRTAMAQLRKPVSAEKRNTQVVNGKLIDMQTGEIISDINGKVSNDIQSKLAVGDSVSTKQVLSDLITGNAITPGARGRIAPSLAVLNSVDALANMNIDGKFTGIGIAGASKEWVKGLFNMKNPEATTNAQNINAINLKVQHWASGASLTAQQTEQVNTFTPTTTDSDKTVRTKMNGLYNFMLTQTQSELLAEGINVEFPTVNLFEVRDLYEKASPEQQALIEQTYFKKK